MPQKACLLLEKTKGSLYPVVYNAALAGIGLNVQYSEQEVPVKKLAKFMDRVRQGEFIGVSVETPFKDKVLDYVNHTTDEARILGEINTLYFEGKVLIGDNTAWYGIKAALHDYALREKRVLIYGAGSAAKAALFALQDLNVGQVFIANRTLVKAQVLANEFGAIACDPLDLPEVDVLINASLVGEKNENYLLFEEDYLQNCELVVDMVPNETMLLRVAKDLEINVISGKAVLLFQLIHQFELFTGLEAPIEVMAKALGFRI